LLKIFDEVSSSRKYLFPIVDPRLKHLFHRGFSLLHFGKSDSFFMKNAAFAQQILRFAMSPQND